MKMNVNNNTKSITLSDTVQMMNSTDWKERLKAKYWQLKIRYDKLLDTGIWNNATQCPLTLMQRQAMYMQSYLEVLEKRAEVEGVDLQNVSVLSTEGSNNAKSDDGYWMVKMLWDLQKRVEQLETYRYPLWPVTCDPSSRGTISGSNTIELHYI